MTIIIVLKCCTLNRARIECETTKLLSDHMFDFLPGTTASISSTNVKPLHACNTITFIPPNDQNRIPPEFQIP